VHDNREPRGVAELSTVPIPERFERSLHPCGSLERTPTRVREIVVQPE
jgi:hypothetical protein